MDRSVMVNGEETPIRTIKMRDGSGTCKISLWRDFTKVKTTVGSHLEVTNAVVQMYNAEKSLSTTSRTKLEVRAVIDKYQMK
jgi:ssDNA-binding replication factor A large subunit